MRKTILAAALALLAFNAMAAKNRWTVDANTTSCDFILNSGSVVTVTASGGFCDFDVSAAPVGPNTTKITPKLVDPIWGNASAAQSTFTFTRPGPPAVATSPTLIP